MQRALGDAAFWPSLEEGTSLGLSLTSAAKAKLRISEGFHLFRCDERWNATRCVPGDAALSPQKLKAHSVKGF